MIEPEGRKATSVLLLYQLTDARQKEGKQVEKYKDYMFYNAENGCFICGGTSSADVELLKEDCKTLLQAVNKRMDDGKKVASIIAHATYTGEETRFDFNVKEV